MVKKKVTRKHKVKSHSKAPEPQTRAIKHKSFWVAMVLIAILSTITILNMPGGVTGQAIARQNIAYAKGDSSLFIEVQNIKGLQNVLIQFSKPVKNSYLLVEQTDNQKKNNVYNSFVISSPDRNSMKNINMDLKIKESDLQKLGILPTQLLIQNNENILTPSLQKTEKGYVYYKVTSTRLGTFTLTK